VSGRRSVTTFALIHGAGDVGWYWHLVQRELQDRGYRTVAPDLPIEDDSAGLTDYAAVVVAAIGDADATVVVGQSFGGYVAPLVAERVSAKLIVLVAGMVPTAGESAEQMFASTGWQPKITEGATTAEIFYHDVPAALAKEAMAHGRRQSDKPGAQPWPLAAWPTIETRAVIGRNDRFFPREWSRTVLFDRLGLRPAELDSGHCPALSRPRELADLLLRWSS
jgi:pimeloyl-ACP methyl ester carboxylesterase